jgi:dynein heavy chain 1
LSGKIVSLFDLCLNQLSAQSHYDFGLRALKSVLTSSGNLKRSEKARLTNPETEIDDEWEQNILLRSLCDTLVPKLIAQDIPLLESLLTGVFPGSTLIQVRAKEIRDQLDILAPKYNIVVSDTFVEKVLQLFQI